VNRRLKSFLFQELSLPIFIFLIASHISGCGLFDAADEFKTLKAKYEQLQHEYDHVQKEARQLQDKIYALNNENENLKKELEKQKKALKGMYN
jgi:peptidoglycan hydrolase CwlO-like protein